MDTKSFELTQSTFTAIFWRRIRHRSRYLSHAFDVKLNLSPGSESFVQLKLVQNLKKLFFYHKQCKFNYSEVPCVMINQYQSL